MTRFPDLISMEERQQILETPKREKTPLNFHVTAEALAILREAQGRFETDLHKTLEILLREYRESRRSGKKR